MREVGAAAWNKVDVHISTDNIVLGGTVEDVFTVIRGYQALEIAGTGHWKYPPSDHVFHRQTTRPYGAPDDGITDDMLPSQDELNEYVTNVWKDMFDDEETMIITVETKVARLVGIPVLTDSGIIGYLEKTFTFSKAVLEYLIDIPGVDPADVHAIIATCMTSRYDHIAQALTPRLVLPFAHKFDAMIIGCYEKLLFKAGAGAAINEERRISKEAVRIIHLKANDEEGGMGIKSLAKLVNAGIYLVVLDCEVGVTWARRCGW